MKPTILFVDDCLDLLRGFKRALRNEPFEIVCANSGDDAIYLLKRHTVHVVVSDESMKGIKGSEFLCWVAEYYPETIRIMLTGQPSVPSMQTAINDAGVFRYLLKPVKQEALVETIMEAIELTKGKSGGTASVS